MITSKISFSISLENEKKKRKVKFGYIFGDILIPMLARWNKQLMGEEKLAKIEGQKKEEETIVRKERTNRGEGQTDCKPSFYKHCVR